MSSKSATAATTAPSIKLTRGAKGWVKKIGGHVRWLAPLAQPELAMQRAVKLINDHNAGLAPQPLGDRAVLSDVCDLFIAAKEAAKNAGALRPRTFAEYFSYVQDCSDFFGASAVVLALAPTDWQRYAGNLAKRFPDVHTRLRRMVTVRMMSRWAYRNEHIPRPFRFGDSFTPPDAKSLRLSKRAAGKRLFTTREIKLILRAAPQPIRCMFLLALNAGFGNTDVASLPVSAVQLDDAMIEFDRPKTGSERRCPLWPETVKDLRKVIAARNGHDSELLFLTPSGKPFVRENYNADGTIKSNTDAVGMAFSRLLAGINAKIKDEKHRIRRSFYDGRRTFRTLADDLHDERAAQLIMGHTADSGDMGSRYIQDIPLDRLKAIVNHVRRSLLGAGPRNASAKPRRGGGPAGAARRKRASR